MITTPFLIQLGLSVNTELKVLICHRCESVQRVGSALEHMKRCLPSQPGHLASQDALDHACSQLGVASTIPIIPLSPNPRKAFSGIKVYPGYGCPDCGFCGSHKRVTMHISSAHPDKIDLAPKEVYIQRLLNGVKDHCAFTVQGPLEQPSLDSQSEILCQQALHFNPSAIMQNWVMPVNPRKRSPWLARSHWDQYIHEKDVKGLCSLVSKRENSKLFSHVERAVQDYLKSAISKLDQIDEVLLLKINTKDPEHG
jgi:hypothetical protein